MDDSTNDEPTNSQLDVDHDDYDGYDDFATPTCHLNHSLSVNRHRAIFSYAS